MTLANLRSEYLAKAAECDVDIERAKAGMKTNAAGKGLAVNEFVFNQHRDDLKIAETRRQVYFQISKDLEDFIPEAGVAK